MTTSLTAFLLDRIAEDEAAARLAAWTSRGGEFDTPWLARPSLESEEQGYRNYRQVAFNTGISIAEPVMVRVADHIVRHDPARVLAECAAKRAIVALADEATGLDAQVDSEFRVVPRDTEAEPYVGDLIHRHLAAVYADHPDYDPAWAV